MPSVAPILHPYGIIIRLIMQIVPFYNRSEIPPNNSIFVSITAALSHAANRFWTINAGNRLIMALLFSPLCRWERSIRAKKKLRVPARSKNYRRPGTQSNRLRTQENRL